MPDYNALDSVGLADPANFVRLRTFYPDAKDMGFTRPSNLFLSDEWTKIFAAGLIKLSGSETDFTKAHVLEVGVGVGTNILGLMTSPKPPASFIGTDICDNAIRFCRGLPDIRRHNVRLQTSDLLSDIPKENLSKLDYIVACIPQVPFEGDLTQGDNFAHYYPPTGSNWDAFGLGLNAKLLEQAKDLTPSAQVVLNLSGRPGIERLKDLFNQFGFEPSVLHEAIVPQHKETSLASLASAEEKGADAFEFFRDPGAHEKICAVEAEGRRTAGQPLYHKIYVIRGEPTL